MSDTIDRQAAIDELVKMLGYCFQADEEVVDAVVTTINELPSAEGESFEWCTDCKEYDQEKHCCHRWTKVIRNTVEELKVVRCKDCKYAEYIDDVQTLWCTECGQGRTVAPYDFCSYGEKREVTE